MRKIIFAMSASLDGFFEGPNREIDWHRVDEELHAYFNEQLAEAGAFLDGRVTHELMAEFWPYADKDPQSTPKMVEFAKIWREKPKILYSRTVQTADWNTTIKREVNADEVRALKEQSGGYLALGGPTLAKEFRRLGLIDEYCVYVHPVLLGRGEPLFRDHEAVTDLELIESRAFGNGVVMLRYRPLKASAPPG